MLKDEIKKKHEFKKKRMNFCFMWCCGIDIFFNLLKNEDGYILDTMFLKILKNQFNLIEEKIL